MNCSDVLLCGWLCRRRLDGVELLFLTWLDMPFLSSRVRVGPRRRQQCQLSYCLLWALVSYVLGQSAGGAESVRSFLFPRFQWQPVQHRWSRRPTVKGVFPLPGLSPPAAAVSKGIINAVQPSAASAATKSLPLASLSTTIVTVTTMNRRWMGQWFGLAGMNIQRQSYKIYDPKWVKILSAWDHCWQIHGARGWRHDEIIVVVCNWSGDVLLTYIL